jgi:hypothetical protein
MTVGRLAGGPAAGAVWMGSGKMWMGFGIGAGSTMVSTGLKSGSMCCAAPVRRFHKFWMALSVALLLQFCPCL